MQTYNKSNWKCNANCGESFAAFIFGGTIGHDGRTKANISFAQTIYNTKQYKNAKMIDRNWPEKIW